MYIVAVRDILICIYGRIRERRVKKNTYYISINGGAVFMLIFYNFKFQSFNDDVHMLQTKNNCDLIIELILYNTKNN